MWGIEAGKSLGPAPPNPGQTASESAEGKYFACKGAESVSGQSHLKGPEASTRATHFIKEISGHMQSVSLPYLAIFYPDQ